MSAPVENIESSNVRQFFNALQRRGEVFTLEEIYARDNKESFKIAVGILRHKFQFVEQGERKLLKIDLKEVHSNARKGKLFHLFLFGSFAVAFKDLKLRKNACVAFRSAVVEKYTNYHTYEDHHDFQAVLGRPDKMGAKIFLLVQSRKKDLNNCPAIPANRRRVAQDEERPCSSAQIAPVYKYKRISELTIPEKNVNMYGVVSQILRGADDPEKHAILRVIDETCKEDQDFEVHIFFGNDRINPRFSLGDIVRLHGMQVGEYSGGKMDGRIFRTSDMVTEKEGAYSTTDSDKLPLAKLHQGIDSRRKEKPTNSVLMIGNVSEEGTYAVGCQILKVHKITDDILILTATDWDLVNNQMKKKEVHIIAVAAPDQLQTIPLHTNVILNDVKASAKDEPEPERTKFTFKMQGPLYTFEVLRRSEEEATSARICNSSCAISCDDSSEESHRSTSRVASRKRRREYTEEERKLIVEYISRKKAHGYVKGREFWMQMEAKKVVPGRTWQSLKEHFCKQIIPRINFFAVTEEEAKKFKQPFL